MHSIKLGMKYRGYDEIAFRKKAQQKFQFCKMVKNQKSVRLYRRRVPLFAVFQTLPILGKNQILVKITCRDEDITFFSFLNYFFFSLFCFRGGGGSLPLEAVPDAREKKTRGKGYPDQGWARKARTAKRVSKSRKTGKWYSNCYDQSLYSRAISGKGR